jgi:hypothetical protein
MLYMPDWDSIFSTARSLSGLAVLNQNSRDRIKLVYRVRKIVTLFDEQDKLSLSIFVYLEQNMLSPTGS